MTTTIPSFGRRKLYTDETRITAENVVDVLNLAIQDHLVNQREIQTLYDIYRGKQPVLEREKKYNKDITNRIVENRAYEIVEFKVGFLSSEPIQYVSNSQKKSVSRMIETLNRYMAVENKAIKDGELLRWLTICGTAYRLVAPAKEPDALSPVHIYTLDPRNCFVVYHSGLGEPPVMGVKFVMLRTGKIVYSVYTDTEYFEIEDGQITARAANPIGKVPIIEYPADNARLGAFEVVLSLLDALSELASNRMDSIEQVVQSLLVLIGVDIKDAEWDELVDRGGIKLPPGGDAKFIANALDQLSTQSFTNYIYAAILTICGMPSGNAGANSSVSDTTGKAVQLHNGWESAVVRAQSTETMFDGSELEFIKLVLAILKKSGKFDLSPLDIAIKFTRRNYEAIAEKSQVLLAMLSSDKIHPKLAFEHSGMFVDPEQAYAMSQEYEKQREAEMVKELESADMNEDAADEEVEAV